MHDPFDIGGLVVVVTGGLGQLGRLYTKALLERGASVAVFDIRADDEAAGTVLWRDRPTDRLLVTNVDVTQRASIESGLAQVEAKLGTPSALINNAAVDSPPGATILENGPFETYPERSWREVMEVGVTGTFLCSQIIGGRMAEARRGAIVNICSIYGLVSPDQRVYSYRQEQGEQFYKPIAYSASKSALLNITRYLATYWADKNVRVNTLTLGGVFNHQDAEFVRSYSSRVPMGRMADESEYNAAIIFLISNASSYMTGSNLVIDGGWTAW